MNWQCIEILLGPDEHVPFIQFAVRNFPLVHPDTGETFPKDLSIEAFPLVPDAGIVKWHSDCAQKLRQRATPDEDKGPTLPPRPTVQPGVRIVNPGKRSQPNYTTSRPDPDYFDSRQKPRTGERDRERERHIPYSHVSSTAVPNGRPVRPKLSHNPSHRDRAFLAPEAGSPDSPRLSRSRRRSVPENMNSPISPHNGASPDPREALNNDHVRRHSHPRPARRGSVSSDASSEREEPPSPVQPRRRPTTRDEGPSIRFEYPSPTSPPHGIPVSPDMRPRPRDGRVNDEDKRRSYPIPIDLNGKLSAPFLLKRDRDRPRNNSKGANVRWKDLGDVKDIWKQGSKSSEDDRDALPRRRVSRHDADLDRDSGSGGGSRSDPKRNSDREVPRTRQPRHSSHEGSPQIDRDREWDRNRERDRDREREGLRSFRDRDRDRERRAVSPVRGVDGRFYPTVR